MVWRICLLVGGLLCGLKSVEALDLITHRRAYSFDFQSYKISSTESIALFGARQKRFLGRSFYWGEGGYGALFGKRSGYIEGGIIAGWESAADYPAYCDLRVFTGAGGGGSAPQGGGFLVNPSVGLGWRLERRWVFSVDLGYIHFVNGNISSATLALNIGYVFRSLEALAPREGVAHAQ